MACVTASIMCLSYALFVRSSPDFERRARDIFPMALWGGSALFLTHPAALEIARRIHFGHETPIWLLFAALVIACLWWKRDALSSELCTTRFLPAILVLPAILAVFLLAGIIVIRKYPNPPIDVFLMQQAGTGALAKGQNPYTATIVDMYGPTSKYQTPFVENGRTLYGSTYPPLIHFMELPSYLLTGDVRYTHLLALIASACLIVWAYPSWTSLGIAIFLVVNPVAMSMVQWAWVEPLALLLFSATLFFAVRYPPLVPWFFGLFLASKQTHLAMLPLAPLVIPVGGNWRSLGIFIAKALAVVAAFYIPFFLWNQGAFLLSLIMLQVKMPLRPDLISYPAYLVGHGFPALPIWLPFLFLLIVCWLCWRNAPRTPSGFAISSGFLMLVFFALSKQGSPNYHFFAFSALCCGLALSPRDLATPHPSRG
jgi:hypothetical protein